MQRDTMIALGTANRVSKEEEIATANILRHGSVTAKGSAKETLSWCFR